MIEEFLLAEKRTSFLSVTQEKGEKTGAGMCPRVMLYEKVCCTGSTSFSIHMSNYSSKEKAQ